MTERRAAMKGAARSAATFAGRAVTYARHRLSALGDLWKSSLQFRVTTSTLALSASVVLVLGMVLQYQINYRLMSTKETAAIAQLQVVVQTAEAELVGDAGQPDQLRSRLNKALNQITSSSVATEDVGNSAAGAFEPVLAAGDPYLTGEAPVTAGPYNKVPTGLRNFVENNQQAQQIVTSDGTTYLIVGAPVTTTSRPLQLYLLFPLTTEQSTVTTVQNTLLVGGGVLLILLAFIANLVVRQVVLPVRRAAVAAESFAGGELDRRLDVIGEDDLAKLAVSYNEMAGSIKKQIRQLEEFGQLQRRFTSDVSHELRTPLTTVRMAADVLHASREQFPAGLARSTELLVDELDRFETLLRDLLEISKLDAGVEELAADVVDVRQIVERAAEQVAAVASAMHTELDLIMPEDELSAAVDARRVERILRNLLGNAIDHGEGRPVRVWVEGNDDAVAFCVRDYGVGLRTGEAELVFNRFWRADPSRNRRTGGTGLGLAISVEDARLHGGRIDAWGEPDQGSCFRLTLPRAHGGEIVESPLPLPPDPPARRAPSEPQPVWPEAEPAESGETSESGSFWVSPPNGHDVPGGPSGSSGTSGSSDPSGPSGTDEQEPDRSVAREGLR